MKYSDEQIDRAAEIYRANPRFAVAGIHFEAFLTAPARCWDLVWGADVDQMPLYAFRPLLPAQVRAQLEADFNATCEMLRVRAEANLAGLAQPLGGRRQRQEPSVRDGRFVQPTAPRAIGRAWSTRRGLAS